MIGIEPTTCWLQVSCSTVEPHQHSVLNWRPGRDSNPRPPAWQAGILTSWTTRPHFKWWDQQGSNLWPPACKAGALPAELWSHLIWSGWRGSNPHSWLGRPELYHWATPARYWWLIGESNPCYRRERAVSWPLDQWATLFYFKFVLAPREGLEPSAYRLTAECSTIELPWNITWLRLTLPGGCPPSTISAKELNFCVRNGNRCILFAIITTSFFRQVLY